MFFICLVFNFIYSLSDNPLNILIKKFDLIYNNYSAGKLIVTKKIGKEMFPDIEDMENITNIYKNPYGKYENEFYRYYYIIIVQ